jgi:D-amino-acid dehydrogenase
VRRAPGRPRQAVVVGAGLVGLCTAWFLQEQGLEVTVLERTAVAAGASLGNAGWITPALVAPLPDPAILREGLRAIAGRSPAVRVPLSPDPALLTFLCRFTRNCTPGRRDAAQAALTMLSGHALRSFDALAAAGAAAATIAGQPVLAAYRSPAQRAPMLAELTEYARQPGGGVDFDVLDGPAVQRAEPILTGAARAAVRIHGQRYLDPGPFVHALADSIRRRGGTIREGTAVTGLRDDGAGVTITSSPGETGPGEADGVGEAGGEVRCDCVVLATGAWLGALARRAGVRVRVQSGRGYSFSVPMRQLPAGPVYLPAQRLACTPMPGGRLRVAGVMELRPPQAPLDPARITAMAAGMRGLLTGAGTDLRTQEWVGARPCTPDGLPVIGATRSPRIFAAGGHGMWGITLGPATGQLLARAIATGTMPAELAPFDPLR